MTIKLPLSQSFVQYAPNLTCLWNTSLSVNFASSQIDGLEKRKFTFEDSNLIRRMPVVRKCVKKTFSQNGFALEDDWLS